MKISENIKSGLIMATHEVLGGVHFVLQTSADGVAALEAKIISSTGRYDYDQSLAYRIKETKRTQRIAIITIKILQKKMNSIFVDEATKTLLAAEIVRLDDQMKNLNLPVQFQN